MPIGMILYLKLKTHFNFRRNSSGNIKIEPTPSPNTMKIVLSEKRADNQSNTYTEVKTSQPDFINDLLQIKDVKSIFHVIDFLAIDKYPKANWEEVLPQITASLQKRKLLVNHLSLMNTMEKESRDTHF